MEELGEDRPVFRDIRRYYCDFCGICRSKKSLIATHMAAHHKEELEMAKAKSGNETEALKGANTCEHCGASFKKPAYLKQHLLSHSIERLHTCSVGDCRASYRRKDHLTRHLLCHKGKLFKCPVENCNLEFTIHGNMMRHVKELHKEDSSFIDAERSKPCVCQEDGCGKAFRYASKLRKHEDSHVKLESVEAVCGEQGCMKIFSNKQCLNEHIRSCHQHVTCEVCGNKHLRKNIKRHLRTHEENGPLEDVNCNHKDCNCIFSNKSNLNQHVRAVHLKHKPFVCSVSGCGMRFSYKHVRDKHEKKGYHIYVHGDFVESDEQFRAQPRGGRKRKCPTVEMLIRKRVTPPNLSDSKYFSALFS